MLLRGQKKDNSGAQEGMTASVKVTCFEDLAGEAKRKERKTVIAVVAAHDENTLESVVRAAGDGIMLPILIGDVIIIRSFLAGLGADTAGYDMIPAEGSERSLEIAVDLINTGGATAIMKGRLESSDFMRALVKKENKLVTDGILSLAGLFNPPKYHKLIAISDIGLNMYPDVNGKKAIIENAAGMLNALGAAAPKVAVLASVEKLNPKMPETTDAGALKRMNQSGAIGNCIVEGPVSFDLATSKEAAKIKNYDSPVAGDADLLIVPDINSGNILAKSLTGMAGSLTAGTVLGAKVPVVFTSRSAEATDKYYSIALAACLAR